MRFLEDRDPGGYELCEGLVDVVSPYHQDHGGDAGLGVDVMDALGRLDRAEANGEIVEFQLDVLRSPLRRRAEGLDETEQIPIEPDSRFDVACVEVDESRPEHASHATGGVSATRRRVGSAEMSESCPPPVALDLDLLARFRDHLADAGYFENAAGARELIQLFDFGLDRSEPEARGALGPVPVDGLVAMGLLARDGDVVNAPAQLAVTGDLVLASDRWTTEDPSRDQDFVIGAHAAAQSAANFSVRTPVATALDLGTGTGVQALLAARHAGRVVGTDVNQRALCFARFNAALNRVRNVSFLAGSWFDPIRGGAGFGLVASNPPFVISPERAYRYRDGGLTADATSHLVVAGAADHLAPGGYASVMSDWVGAGDSDWAESVFAWTAGKKCDTLVIRFCRRDAYEYACMWNDPLRTDNPPEYDLAIGRWMAEFERLGIEIIDSGVVVLRRSDGAGWQLALEADQSSGGQASDELLRIFAGQDLLERAGDDVNQLFGLPFRLVDGHRIEQSFSYEKGAYISHPAVVRMPGGSGLHAEVAVGALEPIFGCDGATPLGALVAQHAADHGIDEVWLRGEVARATRSLLRTGLLTTA